MFDGRGGGGGPWPFFGKTYFLNLLYKFIFSRGGGPDSLPHASALLLNLRLAIAKLRLEIVLALIF